MRELATTLGIGFVSGVLSGAFGIGGGIFTTPAIRLVLGAPALVAVGTPLPVIFPSALAGAITYARGGVTDVRAGVTCAAAGSVTAVLGALATRVVGGDVVLLATAALILYMAVDVVLQTVSLAPRGERAKPVSAGAADSGGGRLGRLLIIGALTGLYSGFLGLGGGFVLVPMLTRWLAFDIKRAIATSLLAIAILAVPGTVTHALLGHVDWRIAAVLAIGVVPGAIVGARLTLGSAERTVRLGFAALLLVVGVWLGAQTIMGGGS